MIISCIARKFKLTGYPILRGWVSLCRAGLNIPLVTRHISYTCEESENAT